MSKRSNEEKEKEGHPLDDGTEEALLPDDGRVPSLCNLNHQTGLKLRTSIGDPSPDFLSSADRTLGEDAYGQVDNFVQDVEVRLCVQIVS